MTTTLAASPSAVAWHEAIHATLAIAQGFQVKRASIVTLETSDGRVQVDRSADLDDARTAGSLAHATMTYLVAPGLAARDAGRAPGDARDRDAAWTLAQGVAEGDRARAEQALAAAETSARALVAIHQGWIARVAEALDRQRTLTHDEIVALRPDEPQTTGDTMTTEAYAQVRERLEAAPEQLSADDIETLAAHDPADRAFAVKRRAAARYELETKAARLSAAPVRPVDAPQTTGATQGRLVVFARLIGRATRDALRLRDDRLTALEARLDAMEAGHAIPRGDGGSGLSRRVEALEARLKGTLPLRYRGVFQAGTSYQAGDTVTHQGGCWIALAETSSVPGAGTSGWRLAVKRGERGPAAVASGERS